METHTKQKRPEPRDDDMTTSSVEISERVREIARSTLHLSDLEIDELFSDNYDHQQVLRKQIAIDQVVRCIILL